jgi:hypothetical protein
MQCEGIPETKRMVVIQTMTINTYRTYAELITIPTFEERYEYLKLDGVVGKSTFGFNRYINQQFYLSPEWKETRRSIILRDNGCDLGCEDFEIHGSFLIHHLKEITEKDIIERRPICFDPNNLITTKFKTHNAIHYGDKSLLVVAPIARTKNDTCPWR